MTKRAIKWALLPALFATAGAVSPIGFSADAGLVNVNDALCLDCTVSPNHSCGTPPFDRVGYCTSGASWCKEPEEN